MKPVARSLGVDIPGDADAASTCAGSTVGASGEGSWLCDVPELVRGRVQVLLEVAADELYSEHEGAVPLFKEMKIRDIRPALVRARAKMTGDARKLLEDASSGLSHPQQEELFTNLLSRAEADGTALRDADGCMRLFRLSCDVANVQAARPNYTVEELRTAVLQIIDCVVTVCHGVRFLRTRRYSFKTSTPLIRQVHQSTPSARKHCQLTVVGRVR